MSGAPALRRPLRPEDEAWLLELTLERRAGDLLALGLPEAAARQVLVAQHHLQRRARLALPGLTEWVLLYDGAPAGHLVLSRQDRVQRVVEVVVLRALQGRGLARAALEQVVAEADQAGLELRLLVEPHHPVRRLYERLGFRAVGPGTPAGVELVRAARGAG